MSGGASAQREEAGMTFDEILTQVLDLLRRDGRVSYRALKRRFDLDEDYLEDLKAEIIQAKKLAVDEAGAVLVWTGDAAMAPALVSDQERAPLAYTPSYLAEKILASRAALEGERKQVTVLFADLKGSTELIEGLDPEEARQLLDPALHIMMDAVHRYEGTVNQVLGDGIMALFGAPVAHEDHAVRACYAALAMQAAMRRYAEEVRRSHGKVTGQVVTLDPALQDAVTALLSLLDALPEDSPFLTLDPPQRRQRTLDAFKRVLLRESREQPLLLVCEDLHWIDAETQVLLNSLVESLPTARLVLLVNYRPEYQHGWGSKTYYTQLRLDPLPPV